MIRAIIIGALFASPAAAQNCAPVTHVAEQLGTQYGETVQDMGIASNGALVQWWGNAETGTWTVIAVTPDGTACLVASGEGFEHTPTAPAPMGTEG